MSKKAIIIGIIVIVLAAAVTTAALYFIKNTSSSNAPVATPGMTTPDLSENYGACSLLTTDSISSQLGKAVFDGFDTGKGNIGNGDAAQNCVYGLTKKVTAISDDMLVNSFYTTVYTYGSQSSKTAAGAVYTLSENESIADIGEKAAFIVQDDKSLGYVNYEVRVSSGQRDFSFSLRQSNDAISLSRSDAKSKLIQLAKSVDYANFQDTK